MLPQTEHNKHLALRILMEAEQQVDYSLLPVADLLKVALEKSPDGETNVNAVTEILHRQHRGLALRLYPNGRRGPYDEGVVPVSLSSAEGIVTIDVGCPGKSFVIPREQVGNWVTKVARKIISVTANMRTAGFDSDYIRNWFELHSTKDFSVAAYTVMSQDCEEGVGVTIYPQTNHTWNMGWKESALFCACLMDQIEAQGWDYSECGLDEVTESLVNKMFRLDY